MDNQSQLIDELISCPLHRENFTLLCSTCEDMHCSQCLLEPAYAKHECSELSQNLKDMFKQQMMDAVSQVEKKVRLTDS
jgi:hypothetical protein